MTFHQFLKTHPSREINKNWLYNFLSTHDHPIAKEVMTDLEYSTATVIDLGHFGTGPWSDVYYDFPLNEEKMPERKDRFGMYDYNQVYTCFGQYIPPRMMDGLFRWVNDGVRPGHFLCAILENDFIQACAQADDENLANLNAYAKFMYNNMPGDCYGSTKKVKAWVIKNNARKLKEKENGTD